VILLHGAMDVVPPLGAASDRAAGTLGRETTDVDQLITLVTERTGISQDQAREAVQTVIGFLKDKLPGPIASQLDGVLGGQGAGDMMGQAQQALGGLGGMFGGNKSE
jgi:hypothetical protein